MPMHRPHRPFGVPPRVPPPPRPRTVSPSAVAPEAASTAAASGAMPAALAPGPRAPMPLGGLGGAGVAARDPRPVQAGRSPADPGALGASLGRERPCAEPDAPPGAPRHLGGTLRLRPRADTPAPAIPASAEVAACGRAEAGRERPRDDRAAPAPAAVAAPDAVPAAAMPGAVVPEAPASAVPAPVALDPAEAAADHRREQAREALALLRARWPTAFPAPVPVPLAAGIARAIREGLGDEHIPMQRIRGALSHWMNDPRYLAAVANGVRRVHLDGTDAGEPDEEARTHARGVLAERKIWMRPPAASVSATPAGGDGGESVAGAEGERPEAEGADAG